MRAAKAIGFIVLLLVSTLVGVSLVLMRYDVLRFFLRFGEMVTTGGFLALLSIANAQLSACCAYMVWKRLRAIGPSAGRGFLFLACAAIALLQSCVAISMSLTASDTSKTFAAMADLGNAEVYALEPGHVIVDGTIGATFFADMMANHSAKEPIRMIEINSNGGLLDQAFLLADFVEKQKVTVIVGDQCLSACVIVAVASPDLTAHVSSIFGFHRSSPLAEMTSQLFKLGFHSIDADSNKFLEEHGVPADIMKQAESHGPDEMYEVKAADLMKSGVVKKVIPDEKINSGDTSD